MADIFVSYSSKDRARVAPIVDALRAAGFDVWWDRDIPAGAPWESSIEAAIRAAKCVIVFWTGTSVDPESGQRVQVEARDALNTGKLVQVLLEAVAPPMFFSHFQAVDLMGWDGSPDRPSWRKVIEDARRILRGEAPPRLSATPSAPTAAFLVEPNWLGPRLPPPRVGENWELHQTIEVTPRGHGWTSYFGATKPTKIHQAKWWRDGQIGILTIIRPGGVASSAHWPRFVEIHDVERDQYVSGIRIHPDVGGNSYCLGFEFHPVNGHIVPILRNRIDSGDYWLGKWEWDAASVTPGHTRLDLSPMGVSALFSPDSESFAYLHWDISNTIEKPPRILAVSGRHRDQLRLGDAIRDRTTFSMISWAPSSARVLVTSCSSSPGASIVWAPSVREESATPPVILRFGGRHVNKAIWHPQRDLLAGLVQTSSDYFESGSAWDLVILDGVAADDENRPDSDRVLAHRRLGHRSYPNALDWSADGRFIATAGTDETVEIWDLESDTSHTLHGLKGRDQAVSFSPDGQRLASCSSQEVIIWDPNTGEQLGRFRGNTTPFENTRYAGTNSYSNRKIWSLDGRMIASALDDTKIEVRRLA